MKGYNQRLRAIIDICSTSDKGYTAEQLATIDEVTFQVGLREALVEEKGLPPEEGINQHKGIYTLHPEFTEDNKNFSQDLVFNVYVTARERLTKTLREILKQKSP
jgi:hypothetical protein